MCCKDGVLEWEAPEFEVRDVEFAESILLDRPSETRWGAFARPYEVGEQERDVDMAAAPQTPKGVQRPRDEADEVESNASDDEDDAPDEDEDEDD